MATNDYSSGPILSLKFHEHLAEAVAEYPRPDHEYEYSTSWGSLVVLPNGNVFIAWAFHSRIPEHEPNLTGHCR